MNRCLLLHAEVLSFIEKCLLAVGTRPSHASSLAQVLVEGDRRGHYSHGLNRLDMYVKDIQTGICARDGEPAIVKETAATALVNGNNLLGPVVGNFCMDVAIRKARQAGIGWVVAYGSNHFGIAGFYSMQALQEDMICTLGTNPISVAAPALNGDCLVVDMATSAAALGKVELHHRRGDDIPGGWGCDPEGRLSTNPADVLNGGGLVPIGGSEETGGHKGFCLGLMVEIFCGMLAGSTYSSYIRNWKVTDRVADLGQCFVAINPANFAPGFKDRMSDLLSLHRHLSPSDPAAPVLVPGDPERMNMQKCSSLGGIPYHTAVVNHMNDFAKTIGVTCLLPNHRPVPE